MLLKVIIYEIQIPIQRSSCGLLTSSGLWTSGGLLSCILYIGARHKGHSRLMVTFHTTVLCDSCNAFYHSSPSMLIIDRKRSHASHLRPDCQCLAERERGLHPALVVWSSSCHLTWGSCLRERRVGCSGLNVSWKRRSCVGHTREDDGSGGLSKQPEHPAALHFSPLCRRARAIQWDVVSDAVDG